jgi:hypothetical protein
MKKALNTLLMLLVALPWSAITAGACPMRHTVQAEQTEPERQPGCCSHKQQGAPHQGPTHDQQNKNAGCNGDCCPFCHLVQDTPQAGAAIFHLNVSHLTIPVLFPEIAVNDFVSGIKGHLVPSSNSYLRLKIPITTPLRI